MKDFQSTKENWDDNYDMIPIRKQKLIFEIVGA